MSTTTQVPARVTPDAPNPAAGVSFADSTGASLPNAAYAELTLVFSLVGVGIAAVMARRARRPRLTFVRTAVALTTLSFAPDLTFGFDTGSAVTLITLHTVAAAIVVPILAGRLTRTPNRALALSHDRRHQSHPARGKLRLRW